MYSFRLCNTVTVWKIQILFRITFCYATISTNACDVSCLYPPSTSNSLMWAWHQVAFLAWLLYECDNVSLPAFCCTVYEVSGHLMSWFGAEQLQYVKVPGGGSSYTVSPELLTNAWEAYTAISRWQLIYQNWWNRESIVTLYLSMSC